MPTITDWIQAASTVILVLVTAVYVWKTGAIAKANREAVSAMRTQTDALLRPYITITVDMDPRATISIRITNEGKSPAIDLKLKCDPPYSIVGQKRFSTSVIPVFNQPIPSFPPGSRLYFPFTVGAGIPKENDPTSDQPAVFTITASYSFGESSYVEVNTIDLRMFQKSFLYRTETERLLEAIAKAVERIEESHREIKGSISSFAQRQTWPR